MTYQQACDLDRCQGCGGVVESRISVTIHQKDYQLCHNCAEGMLQDAVQSMSSAERTRFKQIFIRHGD